MVKFRVIHPDKHPIDSQEKPQQQEKVKKHYSNFCSQAWNSMIMKFILKQANFFQKLNLFSGFQFLCTFMICCRHNL